VVVGEQTRESAGDDFDFEPLGSFSLKGKERQVLVYEVHHAADEGPETIPRGASEAPGASGS
jgi:class 3 adenylate cyclase